MRVRIMKCLSSTNFELTSKNPKLGVLELMYDRFWGRRDRIKDHIKIYPFPSPADRFVDEPPTVHDPYDLTVPYPLGLRTLDLPVFRLAYHSSTTILLRDEYITMYNRLASTFKASKVENRPRTDDGGVIVTGQPGIGKERTWISEALNFI
jgi:hypothetical protein